MKTKLLILQFVLVGIVQSSGQTNLPAILPCSTILTIAGSPYIADSSITINLGCTLTVDPGVEIKMGENTHLIVKGQADFLGSASQPIIIHAKDLNWGDIYLDSTGTVKSTFNYVHIENATNSVRTNLEPAAIYSYCSALEMQNCNFKNNMRCIVLCGSRSVLIKNCSFDSTNAGEKIHGLFSRHVTIDNSMFYPTAGDADNIDFDASHAVMISNNYLYGGGDDGIDIGQADSVGCDSVTIQGNYIYNMFNKGISNGEWSTFININHNLIVGCALGIGAKSGGHVKADHNTLFNNRVGIYSYEHLDQIWGPGHLTVTNSIIAGSDTAWKVDPTAFLSISYSLSDAELMPGTGNIMGDPLFVLPLSNPAGDFQLTTPSPAVDMGDPAFPIDPDGSRTDIGKFNINQTAGINSNEKSEYELIYPNPSNGKFTMRLIPDYNINRAEVLNILGETILKNEFLGNETEYQFDISSQNAGVYYLKLSSVNGFITKKVIVY